MSRTTNWETILEVISRIEKMSKIEQYEQCLRSFGIYRGIEQEKEEHWEEHGEELEDEEMEDYQDRCEHVIDRFAGEYSDREWQWKWHDIYDYDEFKEELRKEMKISLFELKANDKTK